MSKRAMASRDLPEDVVIDILSRLPVKTLMRFRCVCKSWYALITNPSFIAKHLLLNQCSTTLMNNNNASLLVKYHHSITRRDVLSLLSIESLDVSIDLEIRFNDEEPASLQILGPCNGIFCLYDNVKTAVLWNPATGEIKVIPFHRVPLPPDTNAFAVGFGLDPKTNDYKVVRCVSLWYEYDEHAGLVDLYTLSADSWKEIDAHCLMPSDIASDYLFDTCYIKGIFNWTVWYIDDGHAILSFDMGNEVFLKTPLPDICAFDDEIGKKLTVFNESIAVVVYPYEGVEKCFDIWVLNECGLKESWTKQLTIGPLLGVEWPRGFWKDGEFLLENKTGQLISYHPNTREIKDLQVQGHRIPSTLHVFSYTESLVSIKGGYEHEG